MIIIIINEPAICFLSNPGHKLAAISIEDREVVYLFQRLCICGQHIKDLDYSMTDGLALDVLLHGSFPESDAADLWSSQ